MAVDDRKNLAEAVSGFANSDGGVIVWGVKAHAGSKDDANVASELKSIKNLSLFISDLQKMTAELITPAVVGVEHSKIEELPGSDTGYVVTYAPRSEGEPHMARAKDQHRFYYRSGSSFQKMEPFMLADRYGRRPHPKLEIVCTGQCDLGRQHLEGEGYVFSLMIGVKNTGLGLALHPALEIGSNRFFRLYEFGLDGNGGLGLPRMDIVKNGNYFFADNSNTVVYPGRTLLVAKFKTEAIDGTDDTFYTPNVKVPYEIYCEGFSISGNLHVDMGKFSHIRHREIDLFEHHLATNVVESS